MDYSNALWRAGCSTFGPEPLTWSTLAINIAREERLVGGSPGRYVSADPSCPYHTQPWRARHHEVWQAPRRCGGAFEARRRPFSRLYEKQEVFEMDDIDSVPQREAMEPGRGNTELLFPGKSGSVVGQGGMHGSQQVQDMAVDAGRDESPAGLPDSWLAMPQLEPVAAPRPPQDAEAVVYGFEIGQGAATEAGDLQQVGAMQRLHAVQEESEHDAEGEEQVEVHAAEGLQVHGTHAAHVEDGTELYGEKLAMLPALMDDTVGDASQPAVDDVQGPCMLTVLPADLDAGDTLDSVDNHGEELAMLPASVDDIIQDGGGLSQPAVDDVQEAWMLTALPADLAVEDAGDTPDSVEDHEEELAVLRAFVDDIVQDGGGLSQPAVDDVQGAGMLTALPADLDVEDAGDTPDCVDDSEVQCDALLGLFEDRWSGPPADPRGLGFRLAGVVPSLAYSRQQLPFGCALGGDLPARLVTIYIFAFLRQTWARLSPSLAR
ncbi:hypothetical protein WJX74_008271 [Apatococcus lobatus]|uniref:Uncharacterized protein n=1 Tax=Apatococcus lobatus TaxID=904363 RepID=A0AAW1SHG2_9CHLO